MKKIVNLLFNNFQYKILAVVFAFLLWVLASKREAIVSTFELPVTVKVEGDISVNRFNPAKLNIKAEGSKRDLNILKEEGKVTLTLNAFHLKKCKDNESCDIPVTIDMVKISPALPGITIDEIITKNLNIKFEKLIPVILPVRPVIKGRNRSKFLIGKVEPNYVTVYIPESKVGKVKAVYLLPVNSDEIKNNAIVEVKIKSIYKSFPKSVKLYIVRR